MHKPLLARASILSRDLGQLGRREAKFPSSHHGSDAEAARERGRAQAPAGAVEAAS